MTGLLLVSCSDGDAKSGPAASSSECAQTTAPADQTITFIFTYTLVSQGFDERREPFSHLTGLAVEAPAENIEPLTITVSDLNGAIVATLTDVAPGTTCGFDYDFVEHDYFIEDRAHGNGTQFYSSAP